MNKSVTRQSALDDLRKAIVNIEHAMACDSTTWDYVDVNDARDARDTLHNLLDILDVKDG